MNRHYLKVLDRLHDIGKDPVQPLQKYIANAERSRRRQRRLEQSVNETILHPKSSRTDPLLNDNVTESKKNEEPIFYKFCELPIEIRLLIWEAICNTPQVIRVRTETIFWYTRTWHFGPKPRRKKGPELSSWKSKSFLAACTTHSSILMVNREARGVAKKFYKLAGRVAPGYRPVLVNLDVDFVCAVDKDGKYRHPDRPQGLVPAYASPSMFGGK